ncbi:SEC-C metal-binding domain-containing protein [Chitinivorax sp. B]|uniref:YecA family protein n=1 Tax=Chitinivorax sp. B TaxID=2502235 RepID=UPI00148592CC|nr:SEC-C metal-binding domain-containing protein [Chitinivorax sp. B]
MELKLDALETFIRDAVARILRQPEPQALMEWVVSQGQSQLNQIFNREGAEPIDPRLCIVLARQIWNATPLPEHDYRPSKLIKPERNTVCFCGSGNKYKQCCALVESQLPKQLIPDLMPYVLEQVPKTHLQRLPFARMDLEVLAGVAAKWAEVGNHGRVLTLLEPLFKQEVLLDERAEWAFEVLMDSYLVLNKPKKRTQLLVQMQNSSNKFLRAVAWQRLATIHADNGDHEQAMMAFGQAKQLTPDHPALGPLEVTLWLAQRNLERAVERATFWRNRYRKLDMHLYEQPLVFLEQVIADPQAVQQEMGMPSDDDNTWLQPLSEWLGQLPQPTMRYTLKSLAEGGVMLQPSMEMAQLEADWEALLLDIQDKTTDQEQALWDVLAQRNRWLAWLQVNLSALDSFVVLDQLYFLATVLDEEGDESAQVVIAQLIQRIDVLASIMLEQLHSKQCNLPWQSLQNRPLLRMLGVLALWHAGTQQIERLERLVFELNPTDEQVLRLHLSHAYLLQQQPAQALSLAEHFADDVAEMRYNHALALYQLDRQVAAAAQLAVAIQLGPDIAANLVRTQVRRLPIDCATDSAEYDAWQYRDRYLAMWKVSGALSWLKQRVKVS